MNEQASEHRRRAADLGLRMTSTGSCPRRLVGLRHVDGTCWCASRLNDHGRRYRRIKDDKPLILWEPYGAYQEELQEVLTAAAGDGLRVSVTAASPWNPGSTVALIFQAAS